MSDNSKPETEAERMARVERRNELHMAGVDRRNELHKMYHTGIWAPMYWKQFDFPDAEEFEED